MNSKGRRRPPYLAGPPHRTIAGDDRGTNKSVVNSPRDEMGLHSNRDQKQNRNYSKSTNRSMNSKGRRRRPPYLAGPPHRTIAGDDRGTNKSVVNSPRDEMDFHSN